MTRKPFLLAVFGGILLAGMTTQVFAQQKLGYVDSEYIFGTDS